MSVIEYFQQSRVAPEETDISAVLTAHNTDIGVRINAMTAANVTRKRTKSLYKTLRPDEHRVVTKLKSVGIYAVNGRATEFRWIDVVAWGGIPVEVKTSTYSELSKSYRFRVSPTHHDRGIQGDVIVLVCEPMTAGEPTYHIFPSNHPVFRRNDGALKKAVTYSPFSKTRRPEMSKDVLTPELMAQHKDAWQYIEIRRLELIQELRGSAEVQIGIAA